MKSIVIVADPNIYRELGVSNRTEARRFARQVAGPRIWSEVRRGLMPLPLG